MSGAQPTDVLIVGAGLAGLSAAVALSGAGARVRLLERKPHIGGRAYSYHHPALAEEIDSQHLLLGCCTNLIDLCRMADADKYLHWYDRVTMLEPATDQHSVRRNEVGPGGIPAPPRATWNFLRAPMLGVKDKLGIVRGLAEFLRGYPATDEEPVAKWIERTGQTELAVKHFWEPIVLAALNDTFERSSTRYLGMVVHELLLRNGTGGRIAFPTQPLSTFYASFLRLAERQGTELQLRTGVEALQHTSDGLWSAQLNDGSAIEAAQVLLALPFEATAKLLQTLPSSPPRQQVLDDLQHFIHAPITTIHLWFDREVTDLHHAALLDTRIQWMFNKTLIRSGMPEAMKGPGQYLELTISGSFDELRKTREQILEPALKELATFFPKVRAAKLLKSGVLKEARATFSVLPGLDRFRPKNDAPGEGLYLAGDWTRTGWPSTMEGAVRSGRLAAEAMLAGAGAPHTLLTPGLEATGLLRYITQGRG